MTSEGFLIHLGRHLGRSAVERGGVVLPNLRWTTPYQGGLRTPNPWKIVYHARRVQGAWTLLYDEYPEPTLDLGALAASLGHRPGPELIRAAEALLRGEPADTDDETMLELFHATIREKK